ncbi:MAG: hypothetical protein E6R08_04620, partial [Nevskiaceae bacterium]
FTVFIAQVEVTFQLFTAGRINIGEPAEFGKNRTLSRAMCLRASALKRMVPRTSEKRAKAQRHRRP